MQIKCVETLDQLDRLRSDWEAAYLKDPEAHIFLSWSWIRCWLEITPYKWLVLTARYNENSNDVAFLPLIIRGFRPMRVINLGGQPLAPYTGFICATENEHEAISSFSHYIQKQLQWIRFQMAEVLDSRLGIFLDSFSKDVFDIDKSYGMPSLSMHLPDDWDKYLKDKLGYKTRGTLRRRIRQIQGFPGFSTTQIRMGSEYKDIDTILDLWQQRWGPKPEASLLREIFYHFSQQKQLFVKIIWDENIPISGTINLVDNQKKAFYFFVIGVNYDYKKYSPGRVILAKDIKYAIENGFEKFDFLVGADEYKFSFGAKQRNTFNIIITPKGLRPSILNTVLDIVNQISDAIKKYLGKIKRTKLLKWVWFNFISRLKR